MTATRGGTPEKVYWNRVEMEAIIHQRDEAVALLRLALPRLGHPAACCSVRPTEEWEAHGSMSFDNCSCGIKAARAFLASLDGGKR